MPQVKAGKKDIELTAEQAAELGLGEDPELLGCGKNACAYAAEDPDKVVKFTRDELDAMTSYVLSNNPTSWSIPIYDVQRLRRPKGVYIIVAARADELTDDWKDAIDEVYDASKKVKAKQWDDFVDEKKEEMESGWRSRSTKNRQRLYALEVIDEAVQGFKKLGLDWADFHSGNWGIYKGKPVVIDLGLTSSYERPPVRVLNEIPGW